VSTTPRYWRRLIKADTLAPPSPRHIEETMRCHNINKEAAIELLIKDAAQCEYYVNDIYQVEVRKAPFDMVQINIRRRDGATDIRDWRHFQQIKNEIVGPECEAIELYPAESRLVDTSNKWHLWASKDPTFRFPIGWTERDVQYDDNPDTPGMRQRPL